LPTVPARDTRDYKLVTLFRHVSEIAKSQIFFVPITSASRRFYARRYFARHGVLAEFGAQIPAMMPLC